MNIVYSSGYFLVIFDNQELRLPNDHEIPKVNTEKVSDNNYIVHNEVPECIPKNFDVKPVTFWVTLDEVTRIGSVMQYPFEESAAETIQKYSAEVSSDRRVFYGATGALTRTLLLGPPRSFDVPFNDGDDYYVFYDYGNAIQRNTSVVEGDLPGIYRVAVNGNEFTRVDKNNPRIYEILNQKGCIVCEDAIVCVSSEYFTVLDGMIEEISNKYTE